MVGEDGKFVFEFNYGAKVMNGIGQKLSRTIKRKRYGPKIRIDYSGELDRLGSNYGGWVFVPHENLSGSTLLSCGLGEDASFDIEFAQKYGANVVIVDPTPRAIAHFSAIISSLGDPKSVEYSPGGKQEVANYDLREIIDGQLSLVPVALSDSVGVAKFYAPSNPEDVSHSLVNFQNNYVDNTPAIEVPTVDFDTLIKNQNLAEISIAKFDIEGAEIVVVPAMIASGVFPKQVLIEFDELNYPSPRARDNFQRVDRILTDSGYEAVYFDQRSCVTYIKWA